MDNSIGDIYKQEKPETAISGFYDELRCESGSSVRWFSFYCSFRLISRSDFFWSLFLFSAVGAKLAFASAVAAGADKPIAVMLAG
jgi:hypothetical protein